MLKSEDFFPRELDRELWRRIPHFVFEITYWKLMCLSYPPTPLRCGQVWVQGRGGHWTLWDTCSLGFSLTQPGDRGPVGPSWPFSPPPQDSQYPWSQRVSFAKDIASGMVSSLGVGGGVGGVGLGDLTPLTKRFCSTNLKLCKKV